MKTKHVIKGNAHVYLKLKTVLKVQILQALPPSTVRSKCIPSYVWGINFAVANRSMAPE